MGYCDLTNKSPSGVEAILSDQKGMNIAVRQLSHCVLIMSAIIIRHVVVNEYVVCCMHGNGTSLLSCRKHPMYVAGLLWACP